MIILYKLQSPAWTSGQAALSPCPLCVAGMLRPRKQVPEAVAEMGKDPGFLSAGLAQGRAQNKGHLPR